MLHHFRGISGIGLEKQRQEQKSKEEEEEEAALSVGSPLSKTPAVFSTFFSGRWLVLFHFLL